MPRETHKSQQLETHNSRHPHTDCHRVIPRARQCAAAPTASHRLATTARGIQSRCKPLTIGLRAAECAANASHVISASIRTLALDAHLISRNRGATAPCRAMDHGAELFEGWLQKHAVGSMQPDNTTTPCPATLARRAAAANLQHGSRGATPLYHETQSRLRPCVARTNAVSAHILPQRRQVLLQHHQVT